MTNGCASTVADTDIGTPRCVESAYLLHVSSAVGLSEGYPSLELIVSCADDILMVDSHGIPPYVFVPTTPNPFEVVAWRYDVTRAAEIADHEAPIALRGYIGFGGNGIPIYGPYGCTNTSYDTVIECKSSWVQIGDPTSYAWDNHEY